MNFRKQEKYPSCQLIAAINARIFLGGDDVTEGMFEELVDLARCRHGSALDIDACYSKLGLEVVDWTNGIPGLDWVKTNLPVSVAYHDPNKGFHCALIIDVIDDEVVLENSTYSKIKWSDLSLDFNPHQYNRKFRSYKMAEKVSPQVKFSLRQLSRNT